MSASPKQASTVASLLTPPGTAAVAVVGLRGPRSKQIISEIFRPARGSVGAAETDRILFGKLFDKSGPIDDGLVVISRSGQEWHVEINVHGSWRVLQRLLSRLDELQARVVWGDSAQEEIVLPDAGTGEAETARADLAWHHQERVSVDGDEMNRDLWGALACCRTREAVRLVTGAAAGLRVWIDELPSRAAVADADDMKRELQAMLAEYESHRVLIEGVCVALVGPPNSGKSTLANRLYARQAVLESDAPGTTRDWVEEPTTFGGVPIHLIDTAGLREAGEALEDEAVRRGLLRAEQADFRWFVLDPRDRLPEMARYWLAEQAEDDRTLLILNKTDLPQPAASVAQLPEEWRGREIRISARTGEGLDRLESGFRERLRLGPIRVGMAGLICHRQAESVRFAVARCGISTPAQVATLLIADLRGRMGIE